jgi:hypothetical protein
VLPALAALAYACAPAHAPPPRHAAPLSAVRVATRGDTTIEILGPTLVAFFRTTSSAAASNPTVAEAVGAFQDHLDAARGAIAGAGARVFEVYADSMVFVAIDGRESFKPDEHVGYYLRSPGRSPLVCYGVRTDAELIELARAYFVEGRNGRGLCGGE